MKLVVIRHGRAGSPAEFVQSGMTDDLRPLTIEGRRRIRHNAEGLKRLIKSIDVVATSPLVRSVETAQIIAKEFGKVAATEVTALSPGGNREKIVAWLKHQPLTTTVAIVGHEPSLGALITWLLSGHEEPFLELKKGGACCLTLIDRIAAGSARLDWLMTPWQLRRFRR